MFKYYTNNNPCQLKNEFTFHAHFLLFLHQNTQYIKFYYKHLSRNNTFRINFTLFFHTTYIHHGYNFMISQFNYSLYLFD